MGEHGKSCFDFGGEHTSGVDWPSFDWVLDLAFVLFQKQTITKCGKPGEAAYGGAGVNVCFVIL